MKKSVANAVHRAKSESQPSLPRSRRRKAAASIDAATAAATVLTTPTAASTSAVTSAVAVVDGVRFHVVEDHVIILSAHSRCPSRTQCDLRDDESYDQYVRRHLGDHNIPSLNPQTGVAWALLDAERNLGLWCLFYFHKWIQGNQSLLPDPCWDDADFLANGTFSSADLEVGVDWNSRSFKLKSYAERAGHLTPTPQQLRQQQRNDISGNVSNVVDLAQYKRMRKMTKVRETQKTSWCKALVTWRHLRAYFVENNIYFRVMVISAFSALARDNYLEVFSIMWSQHGKLTELFGRVEHTMRWKESNPDPAEERVVVMLDWKKAKIKDGLQLRWNTNSRSNTGQSITSFFIAGVTTATTGRRWDLIVVDDPCIDKNSLSDQMRDKVKRKAAELRKELSAIGELVWLNTPHHLSDASAQIDEKFSDEFHILYRPGRWGTATSTGGYRYYWEYDGICAVDTNYFISTGTARRVDANHVGCDRPRHEHTCHINGTIAHPFLGRPVWTAERVEKEARQIDFYSQVLLLVRDERFALFHRSDFEIIPTHSAPEEVRFGLGHPLDDDEQQMLLGLRRHILAFNNIDTAGKDYTKQLQAGKKLSEGCRNAIIGSRFSGTGDIFITHIHYGFWTPEQECEAMWASCVRNQPESFEYEVSGAHEKYARSGHSDWMARKSQDAKRPISMPLVYINVAEGSNENQFKRIEKVQPYSSTGRIKILADAGSADDIESFIKEFCDFPWHDRRDGPDAFSRVLKRLDAQQFTPAPAKSVAAAAPAQFDPESGVFSISTEMVEQMYRDAGIAAASKQEWAEQGRTAVDDVMFEDRDSVPADPRMRNCDGRAA